MSLGLTSCAAIVAAARKRLGHAVEEEFAREDAYVTICTRIASILGCVTNSGGHPSKSPVSTQPEDWSAAVAGGLVRSLS